MDSRSGSINLLFDETVGEPVARATIEVLKFSHHEIDAVCMKDFEGKGAKDDHWVLRAAKEGRFVITGDRGRFRDRAPLDILLPYHGVSGAFMTGKLHSGRSQFEKARAIITL